MQKNRLCCNQAIMLQIGNRLLSRRSLGKGSSNKRFIVRHVIYVQKRSTKSTEEEPGLTPLSCPGVEDQPRPHNTTPPGLNSFAVRAVYAARLGSSGRVDDII